jgi:hypothetical protein
VARSLPYLRCRKHYSPIASTDTAIHYYTHSQNTIITHHRDSQRQRSCARHACCLQLSRARHDKTRHPATLTGLRARDPDPHLAPASTNSIHFPPTPPIVHSPLPCTSQPYCNPLLPVRTNSPPLLRSFVPSIHLHPRKQQTFAIASKDERKQANEQAAIAAPQHSRIATPQQRNRTVATTA